LLYRGKKLVTIVPFGTDRESPSRIVCVKEERRYARLELAICRAGPSCRRGLIATRIAAARPEKPAGAILQPRPSRISPVFDERSKDAATRQVFVRLTKRDFKLAISRQEVGLVKLETPAAKDLKEIAFTECGGGRSNSIRIVALKTSTNLLTFGFRRPWSWVAAFRPPPSGRILKPNGGRRSPAKA
jgi:hypothetical protein